MQHRSRSDKHHSSVPESVLPQEKDALRELRDALWGCFFCFAVVSVVKAENVSALSYLGARRHHFGCHAGAHFSDFTV